MVGGWEGDFELCTALLASGSSLVGRIASPLIGGRGGPSRLRFALPGFLLRGLQPPCTVQSQPLALLAWFVWASVAALAAHPEILPMCVSSVKGKIPYVPTLSLLLGLVGWE